MVWLLVKCYYNYLLYYYYIIVISLINFIITVIIIVFILLLLTIFLIEPISSDAKWLNKVAGKNDSFTRAHEDPFVLIKQEENKVCIYNKYIYLLFI